MLAALAAGASCFGHSGRLDIASTPMRFEQRSGTTAQLFAVSPVNDLVAWVSGARGTWLRTVDGGATWTTGRVPDGDSLQFRDLRAIDARTAYYLSIGNGPQSRIYRTTDAGATWTLQFTNDDPKIFLDCIDFWDARHGLALGDAVGAEMVLFETRDGEHWARVPAASLPAARTGDGSFATSGTCVVTRAGGLAWLAVSTTSAGRVFQTTDYGRTWRADSTPFGALTGLSFSDARHGFVFSGITGDSGGGVAATADGGRSWQRLAHPSYQGGVYGGAVPPGTQGVVAVGLHGAAWARSASGPWTPLDTSNYWGVAFSSRRAGWAVGAGGRITRFGGF
jgi:photosystem II stability/assembly factor-like uncharacterized protein